MRRQATTAEPVAPTGEVTLLFTDIAGSTRMWEQHGDRFIAVHQAHDAIVREACDRFGGYEVKSEGDAFMLAFSDPVAAVRCALFAQSALARYPWPPDVGALRVRMGMHTGKPFIHDNDYFGPAVNTASRICGAANGGQVLISDETYHAIRGGLDPSVEIDDLGSHRLKDMGAPVRLRQARGADMDAAGVSAPRSLSAQPNNLPQQRTSFVARSEEIERIAAFLAAGDKPVLTLTGPGGIGKTRLSLQAAAEFSEWFPDGVWYVRLVESRDVVGAAVEIAAAMNIPLDPRKQAIPQVRAWLARRRCLLILDDAGSLPQPERLVRELLSGASDLRCLATSREPLGIEETDELPLSGLAYAPATAAPAAIGRTAAGRLFLERRAEVADRLGLRPEEMKSVEKLLELVEGVPASVERAARLIDNCAPSAIVKWLVGGPAPARAEASSRAGAYTFRDIVRRSAQRVKEAIEEPIHPPLAELGDFVQSVASVATDRNNETRAVALGRESLRISQEAGSDAGTAAALRHLARVYWQRGDRDTATAIMTVAVQQLQRHGAPEAAEAATELAEFRRQLGRQTGAATPSVEGAVALAMGERAEG